MSRMLADCPVGEDILEAEFKAMLLREGFDPVCGEDATDRERLEEMANFANGSLSRDAVHAWVADYREVNGHEFNFILIRKEIAWAARRLFIFRDSLLEMRKDEPTVEEDMIYDKLNDVFNDFMERGSKP